MTTKHAGFTLIEVMMVLVIIGVLTSLALPNYGAHVLKSRRGEAQAALVGFANAMERHYVRNNTYLGAGVSGADTGAPLVTLHAARVPRNGAAFYNLTIFEATATRYTLRADPQGPQDGNGLLEFTSLGVKRWDRNDDGDTDDVDELQW